MENLEQIVTPTERTLMLKEVCLTDFTVGKIREHIAEMVEMAYLAGANNLELRRQGNIKDPVTTGEVVTRARNFVKDKGLRI